jgi:small conductance mechanosensitive channel
MEILSPFHGFILKYGPRIVIAVIVLIIGYFFVKLLKTVTVKSIEHSKIDSSVASFLKPLFISLSYFILLMIVLTIAGIPSSYFAGLIIGIGTALGFSLRDQIKTLSSGIIILVTRSYKVKDTITVGQFSGTVTEIRLFQTHLKTADNLEIIMNNGTILSSPLTILNKNDTQRLDIIISVSYENDIQKVKELLQKITNESEYVLKDPKPLVALNELVKNSASFLVRIWTKRVNSQQTKFSINEQIKLVFDKEKVSML